MPANSSRSSISPLDVRSDHLNIVREILRRHLPDREVVAFGSRAKGTARATSDLDLAILGDEPLGVAMLGTLQDDFSESDIPYKIDIVDWATCSEEFRGIIEKDGEMVQRARAIRTSPP